MSNTHQGIQAGDIAYFRKCKNDMKAGIFGFKGTGYGVFLGHIPLGAPPPPPVVVFRQLADCGFFPIEDIRTFLGDEALATFTEKFLDKYYGRKKEEIDAEFKEKQGMTAENAAQTYGHTEAVEKPAPEIITRPPLQLVGPTGRPISSDKLDNPEEL